MSIPDRSSQANQRLADRLAAVQRKHFVGRAAELALFQAALHDPEPPFAVLHVHGPGGIGKTSLLSAFLRLAQEARVFAIYLDGRNIDPSPPSFLNALRLLTNNTADPLEYLAHYPQMLLVIDTYECLTPLDDWLRDTFLPQLPGTSLTVIAGRNPPQPAWRTAPGWRDLTRIIALRNLQPDESRVYLSQRGIPPVQQGAVLQFTHGHPLALSLVADVLGQQDAAVMFDPQQSPDVVRVLLEHFVEHVPSSQYRAALEVCAHVRMTTESLLAEMFDPEAAHKLFQWLGRLSFIEQNHEGLFPHDLARDVLDINLRWRNPDYYRQLHLRVRHILLQRIPQTQGVEQQRAYFDVLFLHRNSPLLKSHFEWDALGHGYTEPAAEEIHPDILDMVRKHEGEDSARIAAYWLQRQPQAFLIFRNLKGEIIGFMANLVIQNATLSDIEADPAVRSVMGFIHMNGGLRANEEVVFHRFSMGREVYQFAPSVYSLVATGCVLYWLTHPRLAWDFIAVGNLEFAQEQMSYINHSRCPTADFEVDGRRYGVFAHDWRVEPLETWLDVTGERELADDLKAETLMTTLPAPLVVLSQPEFAEAVRHALRDYTQPDALAGSPLLCSRLVLESAGSEAPTATLLTLLREAAENLKAKPKTEKFYRAVYHTYLQPAPTQEIAAEILDLPFGTYRYQLAKGVEQMIHWLWQREIYGFDTQ